MDMEKSIVIYQTEDGKTNLEVTLENDSVWLTQEQLSTVFNRERSVITKHIRNVFREGELEEKSNVQILHIAFSDKPGKLYSLDVIISVGYRVKSVEGTRFRIWATNVLKQHLLQGYSINEQLLSKQQEKLAALTSAIKLLGRTAEKQVESLQEAAGLIKVLTDYAYALDVLDSYDHDRVVLEGVTKSQAYVLQYPEAMAIIELMRGDFGGLFGVEKDQSFKGSLAAIYQSFGETALYPSIEEKAANLLYFVVKNHSFSDGNKRIAAAIFLHFLRRNNLLYDANGEKCMADSTLIAITLMIAESRPQEKDIIVKIVANLIASDK
ncbi:MAG: RhuM family protein [Negativicutes bacterium]|jgi:prophage maintenance system killer protein